MKVTARDGETGFVGVKWRKPVAALINGGTRSGKEVLAYGFKEYRLGELIGVRTEGAVLAATAFLIGDKGLLLLAVEDVWSTAIASKASGSSRPSRSRSIPATLPAPIRSSTAPSRFWRGVRPRHPSPARGRRWREAPDEGSRGPSQSKPLTRPSPASGRRGDVVRTSPSRDRGRSGRRANSSSGSAACRRRPDGSRARRYSPSDGLNEPISE